MTFLKQIFIGLVLVTTTFLLTPEQAFSESRFYTGFFSKTAIKGYDVVEYFQSNMAKKGSKNFSTTYEDVNWYFINETNLNAFKSNPKKFIPQYGGWCAYAMADGNKVAVDPKSFDIKDGKLYLNYNKKIQKKWKKKQDQYILKANKYWEKF